MEHRIEWFGMLDGMGERRGREFLLQCVDCAD